MEDLKLKEEKEIKEIYYKEENKFKSEIMYSISLETLQESLVIVSNENKKSNVNNLSENEAKIKLDKIFSIIKNWKTSYISKSALDGLVYKIVIVYNDKTMKKIIGRNRFPENFSDFKEMISGE